MPMKTIPSPLLLLAAAATLALGQMAHAQNKLLEVLKDENARGADFWIYNDIVTARADARRTSRPLFVTFRCVPCADCKGFDAEVA